MKTIILTIKPEHLLNVRRRVKLREIRKTCPKELPFRALCCQSGSGGRIKAEFIVEAPIWAHPAEAPELVADSCISMTAAEKYADGKKVAFWDVTNMIDYCTEEGYSVRNIAEFGLTRPPQSWCYVEEPQC